MTKKTAGAYREMAQRIREMNRWRRGEGRYEEAGVDPPEPVKEWGMLLDEVAEVLEHLDEGLGRQGTRRRSKG